MTKAHKLSAHTLEGRAPGSTKPRRHEPQVVSRADSIALLRAQLIAHSDGEARIARVKMLKARVEAGTYCVDSKAIARKMRGISHTENLSGIDARDILREE